MPEAEPGQTNYMIWPNDTAEELARDGSGDSWTATLPGMYEQLREAGFPLNGGADPHWAEVLDFAVRDDGTVVAFTEGSEPVEREMPAESVAPLLERWNALEKA